MGLEERTPTLPQNGRARRAAGFLSPTSILTRGEKFSARYLMGCRRSLRTLSADSTVGQLALRRRNPRVANAAVSAVRNGRPTRRGESQPD